MTRLRRFDGAPQPSGPAGPQHLDGGQSGHVIDTEPVVRVMVEAATQAEADKVAESLAVIVKDNLAL